MVSVFQGGMVRYSSNQTGVAFEVRIGSGRQLLRGTFVLDAFPRNERPGKSQMAGPDPSWEAILKENLKKIFEVHFKRQSCFYPSG